jgi:hypothetical protein
VQVHIPSFWEKKSDLGVHALLEWNNLIVVNLQEEKDSIT